MGFADADDTSTEWFPSVIAARGGVLKFGLEALRVSQDPAWSVLRSFKRLLSGEGAAPGRTVELGGDSFRVIDLLAEYLRALRTAILESSSARRTSGAVSVVVGTPANAHGTQRFLTIEAFRRAGFDVVAMINEPSAAGFEYTHRYRATLTSRRRDVIVYDLGGGTFDASRIRTEGRHHTVLRTAGINQLGGDDFDARLAVMVLDALGREHEDLDDGTVRTLLDRCRTAKEQLNPNSRRIAIELDGLALPGETRTEITLAASEYYAACDALIEQSVAATDPLLALDADDRDAEGTAYDVAGLYVVGGASALPAVGRKLRERYGSRVHRSPYPFASTAIGLAVALDSDEGFEVSDQLSRHFGVFREGEHGQAVTFDAILRADTRVPSSRELAVLHRRRYRPAHNIGHFRFAEVSAVDDAGHPHGEITPYGDILFPFDRELRARGDELSRVAVQRTPGEGPVIEEQYSVDPNGIVHVAIVDLENGYRREFQLGSSASAA